MLEYASRIWHNCTQKDNEQLEQLQLDVDGIITGMRKGTSHDFTYRELIRCHYLKGAI